MGNLGHLGDRRGLCAAGWDMGGEERGKEGGKSDGDGTGLAPLRGGAGGEERFQHSGGHTSGRGISRDRGDLQGAGGQRGALQRSVGVGTGWGLCVWSVPGPYTPQPGLCVPWWGEGLSAGQWGLEGGPREGTTVGGGEMTWGGRGKCSTARKVGGGGPGHQESGTQLLSDAQRARPPLQHPSLPTSLASLGSGRGTHLSRLNHPSNQGFPPPLRPQQAC